jgi:hypothetical protein
MVGVGALGGEIIKICYWNFFIKSLSCKKERENKSH